MIDALFVFLLPPYSHPRPWNKTSTLHALCLSFEKHRSPQACLSGVHFIFVNSMGTIANLCICRVPAENLWTTSEGNRKPRIYIRSYVCLYPSTRQGKIRVIGFTRDFYDPNVAIARRVARHKHFFFSNDNTIFVHINPSLRRFWQLWNHSFRKKLSKRSKDFDALLVLQTRRSSLWENNTYSTKFFCIKNNIK